MVKTAAEFLVFFLCFSHEPKLELKQLYGFRLVGCAFRLSMKKFAAHGAVDFAVAVVAESCRRLFFTNRTGGGDHRPVFFLVPPPFTLCMGSVEAIKTIPIILKFVEG